MRLKDLREWISERIWKIRWRSSPEKERSYLQDFFWKSQRAVKCRYVQGTIDSDYRGEVKVALINWGSEAFVIHDKDRIAQMVAARYEKAVLTAADELSETERGSGGFGHTGI